MASQKVYEGEARLNITPFLDALKKMETEAGSTGGNIAKVFQNLEQSLGGSIAALKGHLASVATEVTAIKSAVSQANASLQASAKTQQQASQQAQAAAQQSTLAQQQQAAAAKAAAIEQQLAAQQAGMSERDLLDLRVAAHNAFKGQLARMTADEVLAYKERGHQIEAELHKEMNAQQAIRTQALQQAAAIQKSIAAGTAMPGAASEEQYRNALARADAAFKQATTLEKQLTAVVSTEQTIRTSMQNRGIQELTTNYQGAFGRLKGVMGNFGAEVRNQFVTASEELKRFEDKINSLYRAGAQLTQLGSQMIQFGRQVVVMGKGLADNAGEFDFWARRAAAASKAAQDSTGEVVTAAERAVVSTEAFRERALQVGAEVGVASPKEIAQSWYIYQSAVGDVIRTTADLEQHQHNLGSLMRAGIATGTDFAAVVRGTTAAMAEFGLGAGDLDYALSVMINTTQVTQAEFSDMLQAFKMAGPQANRLGMSIGDTAAAFAMLADQNIRGSQAGRLFQSGLTNLIRPTDAMKDALQDLMVTSRGLTGSWEQFFYKNGEFVGLFDQYNEKGELLNRGALRQFHEATKTMTAAEREFYLASIFGKDAGKAWSTMVGEYSNAQKQAEAAGEGATNKFEQMARAMNDQGVQTKAFSDQWKEVADGIKVKMGIVMFSFEELKQRLGVIVAEQLIPMLQRVRGLAEGVMEWAKANPEAAASLVQLGIKLAAVLLIVGPFLTAMGLMIQGISGLVLAGKTIATFGGFLGSVISKLPGLIALGGGFTGLLIPIALITAAVVALYLAWKYNIGGLQEVLGSVVGSLKSMLAALGGALLALAEILAGVFSGNSQLVQDGARKLAERLLEIFVVLPVEIGQSLMGLVENLGRMFTQLGNNAVVWGRNLAVSLANGLIEGGQYLYQAAYALAESVARLFRSFSPPKYGPLRQIKEWGTNLVNTLIEGMSAADFEALDAVAGRVGEAIKRNIEDGLAVPSTYANTVGAANNLVDDMLQTVREGGRVNTDFFTTLKDGLGEWYEYITQIAVAYQDVYANERQLEIEKQKLEAIKGQRQELERQARLREDAFEKTLGATDGFGIQQNEAAMVDPLTPEGQAKIAEMKRNLSREDFQNWIAFQKRLWESRKNIEDETLAAQEEAVQAQIDNTTKQLDAAQKQYELYVQMYEYAVKMYELAEQQKALEEQAAKEKDPALSTLGTPQDLSAQLAEIAKVIGKDQAVQDEGTIRARSQDELDAIGEASAQREREEARLSELEKLNRRKRAEFEVQLINATSDEERARVKQMKDAWDAAYQQEKSRLAERVALAREVQDATEKMADATLAGRIEPQQAEFQRQITQLLGDQTKAIEDANALKAKAGDLDEAKLLATAQQREEERKLSDLQALGDQKRLDFEKRIREAAGDDEKIRRIKEEQTAWEAAYKQAYEAQQLRVELARRAQQDIADSAAALNAAKKGPEGFQAPNFGEAGALDPDEIAKKLFGPGGLQIPWEKAGLGGDNPRPSMLKSIEMFNNIGKAFDFLTNEAIPVPEKMKAIGEAIKEYLGYKTWWDALAPEETRAKVESFFGGIKASIIQWGTDTDQGFNDWVAMTKWKLDNWAYETDTGFNTWVGNIKGKLDQWAIDTDTGFNTWVSGVKSTLDTWATNTDTGFNTWAAGVKKGLDTWATETDQGFNTWVTNVKRGLDQWATDTDTGFNTWVGNVKGYLDTWATETDTSFNTWASTVGKTISDFLFGEETGLAAKFGRLSSTIGDTLGGAVDIAKQAIQGLWDKATSFFSWLTGKKKEADEPTGDGKGGGGGGSYAMGLPYVPFDMFKAYLHKGEMVLTAAEATAYRAAQGAAGVYNIQQTTTNTKGGDKRVEINVGRIDASNPDEGRALLNQLAFYGG